MSFLLTNLLQNIYSDLGQTAPKFGNFVATGGTSVSFVNTNFNNFESPPEADAFKNYVAFVVRDAGGANAAPEGEWSTVSAYADSTWTGTIALLTGAVASGDTIMLAKQDLFPIQEVIFRVNKALLDLGDIPGAVDTSLTTASNQTEYDIPANIKRGLREVYYQGVTNDSNDNRWIPVFDKRNEPSAAGAVGKLYMPQLGAGRVIRLVYTGVHPNIALYNSPIEEAVHPKVAILASELAVLEWFNRLDGNQGGNEFFLWLEGEIRNKHLPQAKAENPIKKPPTQPKYFEAGRGTLIDTWTNPLLT